MARRFVTWPLLVAFLPGCPGGGDQASPSPSTSPSPSPSAGGASSAAADPAAGGAAPAGPEVAGKPMAEWLAALDRSGTATFEALRAEGEEVVEPFAEALEAGRGSAMARGWVCRLLSEVGGASVAPALVAGLEQEGVRQSAMIGLGRLGPDAAEAAPALVARLDDPELADEAKRVLRGLGPQGVPAIAEALTVAGPEARPDLADALGWCARDADPPVQEAARAALLEAAGAEDRSEERGRLIDDVLFLGGDADPHVLEAAIRLGPLTNRLANALQRPRLEEHAELLVPALADRYVDAEASDHDRAEVFSRLRYVEVDLPDALCEAWAEELRAGDRDLRELAAPLARSGHADVVLEQVAARVAEGASLPTEELRRPDAEDGPLVRALEEVGRAAPEDLRAALRHDAARVRWLTATAVAGCEPPPPAGAVFEPLLALVGDAAASVRSAAALALREYDRAPEAAAAIPALQRQVAAEEQPTVRSRLESTLDAIEAAHPDAAPSRDASSAAADEEDPPLLRAVVVDEAGEPLEAAYWDLSRAATLEQRQHANDLHDEFFEHELTDDGTFQLDLSTDMGPQGLSVRTRRGILWAEVDPVEGETQEVRLVAEPPGRVRLRYRSPDEPFMGQFSPKWTVFLVQDGRVYGSARLEGETGETVEEEVAAIQPGRYTLVARGTFLGEDSGSVYVEDRVVVRSGRTAGVRLPTDVDDGGLAVEVVDDDTGEPVPDATAYLCLDDQPYVIAAFGEQVTGVEPGSYRVVVEAPGYERREERVRLAEVDRDRHGFPQLREETIELERE